MLNPLKIFKLSFYAFTFIKKRALKSRIIYGSIALILVACVQVCWFFNAYDAHAAEFEQEVSTTLFRAADTLSQQVSVKRRSANCFFVTAKLPVTSKSVDTLVQQAFSASHIGLDYELGVYNAEDDSLIYVASVKSSDVPMVVEAGIQPDEIYKNFAVTFPSRSDFLMGQKDLWLLILLVLMLLFWAGYLLIRFFSGTTVHTKNQIQLSNSCLDFHNRSLTVNQSTFSLTYKENQILKLLFENPNQVIERKVFLENVWQEDGFFVARSMDVFISRVRKYLSEDHSIKIENLRSIGYRLHVVERKRLF